MCLGLVQGFKKPKLNTFEVVFEYKPTGRKHKRHLCAKSFAEANNRITSMLNHYNYKIVSIMEVEDAKSRGSFKRQTEVCK